MNSTETETPTFFWRKAQTRPSHTAIYWNSQKEVLTLLGKRQVTFSLAIRAQN